MDQLSLASSAELVQSILQGGEVMPEVRELILARATGNPLFMEEFTHSLLENGSIQKKDHEYVLSRKASDIQVPDTIQGIIAARMDRLEDSLKRTMQVASVIGRDFAFRILQTITGMREELKSYLLDLQGLEFIYEKSLFPELEYIFKNALTQEVAYNSLLLKRRKEIHEKIGQAIEELYPDRLEEFYEMLAHHYSRSENLEKAYQYLLLSAMKVGFNYSLWEAFRFGKEAINVLNQMPQTEENKRRGIDGRLLLGLVMYGLGYPEDSLEILQEGERLSKELGDERSLTTFYSSIGLYYSFRGDSAQGIKYSEKSFEEAQKIGDIALLAPIGVDLCMVYYWAGEFSRIVEVAPQVIASLEKTQRESEFFGRPFNPYSALLAQYGSAMGYLGDFAAGEALCDKGLAFALEIHNLVSISFAEVYYSALFCTKGDGRNAVEHAQNAVRCSEETQAVTILAPAWMCLGWGYYFLGELETAIECSEKGLGMQRDAGFSPNLPSFYLCLGGCHFDSGDLAKARSCSEEALELSQKNCERHQEGQSRYLLGRVLGKMGPSQYGKAEEYILQGIGIYNELKLKPYCYMAHLLLGELYAAMGQREKALETLQKAQGMFQEMGMDYYLARTQSVLERLQR
jgi:tetratricopeptide (TPR) repeat protein